MQMHESGLHGCMGTLSSAPPPTWRPQLRQVLMEVGYCPQDRAACCPLGWLPPVDAIRHHQHRVMVIGNQRVAVGDGIPCPRA